MKSVNKNPLLSVVGTTVRLNLLLTLGMASAIVCSVILALLPPLVLEKATNALSIKQSITFATGVFYFALIALSGLSDALREMLITIFGQKITRSARHEMSEKLNRLPAEYFTRNEPGAIVSRFVGDVDTVETLFTSGIISMFADVCKTISILIVIFIKSTGLGILMLVITPLLFLFTRFVQRRMLSAQIKNREAIAQLNNHVPETIRNIRMIHIFRREKYMENKYDRRIGDSYSSMEHVNFYDSVYSPIIIVISTVIIAIMMVMAATGGAAQSFFGISVGTAVAIIAYVGKVFDPLESIGMEIQNIQSAIAGVKRISEFLSECENEETDCSITASELISGSSASITLSGVSFSYSSSKPVLSDLSFTIAPGENVTLYGRTGAGKSTVFKLILGFYPPQCGEVLIFGKSACTIPNAVKRRLFGYVEQRFHPVPGSVYDQIAVFDPELCQSSIEKAAELARIHEVILNLPNGYDTPYSENLFSQGQLQLIAIARAVAADPAILLLDEITANLDAETEERVFTAIKNAAKNRTVISISHRLYEDTGGRIIEIPVV